jgi:hypothetical protein
MEGGLYATSSTHIIAKRFTSPDSERDNRSGCFYADEDYLFYQDVLA